MTVMVYKAPGPHKIHGHMLNYHIVDEDEVADALKAGWHLTTPEAVAELEAAKAEPKPAPKKRGRKKAAK